MAEHTYHWVVKAHKYSSEHPSVLSVSEIATLGDHKYSFTADFRVNLPGLCDITGQTKRGVRKKEPVEFVFHSSFPFKAPEIFLRDDFCRDFPHINPSLKKVKPCIYYGNLDELLQQPKWFDNLLDQMADWLEKAAEDSLIDYAQGWEPMRSDDLDGIIWYDKNMIFRLKDDISSLTASHVGSPKYAAIYNEPFKKDKKKRKEDRNNTKAIIFRMPERKISDKYIPNYINTFQDLCDFAEQNHLERFREKVNGEARNLNIVFLVLVIRRPTKLIGSSSPLELLNFGVEIKQSKNKKIKSSSRVYFLSHRDVCTPKLLRRFSGTQNDFQQKTIVQLGCGSLGSKISLHLARNGNDIFVLIDKALFSPHNNARHALVESDFEEKAKLLEKSLSKMRLRVVSMCNDAMNLNSQTLSNSIIIDSSASLSVRNFLSEKNIPSPIVHTSLYNNAKLSILAAESPDRNPRLNDLIVSIFSGCLNNKKLRDNFLSEQAIRMSTGQGCGSYTTIAPDARISLAAAGMSSRIQYYLDNGLPGDGEIFYSFIDEEDMGIEWNSINCGKVLVIPSKDDEYEIRLLSKVVKQMEIEARNYFPKETGGVLIGHISLINRCITVSDLTPAPEDSKRTRVYFELGIKGLLKKVKDIERKSNGLLTYIGTWHSHPDGGSASNLDKKTKERIKELRNYEPTVCLIWTGKEIKIV